MYMSGNLHPPNKDAPFHPLCGLGLRAPHYEAFAKGESPVSWVEVHPENFKASTNRRILNEVRSHYDISLHSVGMSLGRADALNHDHLFFIRDLAKEISPFAISDHVSWSQIGDQYLNDLLPLPYTEEALDILVAHIQEAQDILQQRILVENPSSYLTFSHSTIAEWDFMREVVRRADCNLLLDLNNVYVTCLNHGYTINTYLDALPHAHIKEVHLAGHAKAIHDGKTIRIDDHGGPVHKDVWDLYATFCKTQGNFPTLIEWDTNIPSLPTLEAEAQKASHILYQNERACVVGGRSHG